jgi:hypothetical protein
MNINGHHIIRFVMQRWGVEKKAIEALLCLPETSLSREKFPRIDLDKYYNQLFDLSNPVGAAAIAKEKEPDLLISLRDYLLSEECERDAKVITRKLKPIVDRKNSENSEESKKSENNVKDEIIYKETYMEILRRANTQPSKRASSKEKESRTTDNSEGESQLQINVVLPDNTDVQPQVIPLAATIASRDGASTAMDVLVPKHMRDFARRLRNKPEKR